MKAGAYTGLLLGAMLALGSGCGGKAATEPVAPDTTAGGEVAGAPAAGAPEDAPTGTTASESPATSAPAQNPWGATRAEQCKRPPRPSLSSRAVKPFNEGVAAAAAGDRATAEASFQQALKRDPNAFPALYNLGVFADRDGDEAEALDYYRRALRVVPDYEPAARGIATIQTRRGQTRTALSTVEPLANAHRANLEMQALYAEVLVEARRIDEAWMAARRALKCDERFVPALIALIKASRAQGRDELADSILEQALEIDPGVAELHFFRGEQLENEPGRLREALQAYERAVQLRPSYVEARMALGVQLLAGGNYPGALSHFQAAERLVPTQPAVHVNLGDAYRATQRWSDAQQAYRRALQLQRKLPEAHYGLGLLFLTAAGDFPGLDELTAYEKAVDEFQIYRAEMGPRLAKDDQSEEYLRDLDRMIKRARRRAEREQGGGTT